MSIALEKNDTSLKKTIRYYSLAWILFFVICVLSFYLLRGRSFFLDDDGLHQQYPYFVYTGIWIRRLFDNLFIKHILELPMWDMSIGMGADPLIVMINQTILDPLYWVSALFPVRYSEYIFDLIIAVKFYLSGLAFIFLANHHGHSREASIAGAMVYVFSSITYVGFSQANFLNAFYLFPFLMIGVDRLWNGKGSVFYTVTVFLCVLYDPYFLYIMGLLVIFYCIIRAVYERIRGINLIRLVLRFVVFTFCGILMGIGPCIPSLINLASLDRFEIAQNYIFFSTDGIVNLLGSFFSYINRGGTCWGVSSFAAVAVIVLFMQKHKNIRLKIMLMLYSFAFLFPIVGSIFNGMNYASERYIFGYVLLLAYIVTAVFDDIRVFKGTIWLIASFIGLLVLGIQFMLSDTNSILSGISFVICIFSVGLVNSISRLTEKRTKNLYMCIVLTTCFILSYAGLWRTMTLFSVSIGEAVNLMTCSTGDEMLDTIDGSNTRFDRIPYSYPEIQVNSSLITGNYGYDSYNSNYDNYLGQYYSDLAVISGGGITTRGFRGRCYAGLMNATSHIIVNNTEKRCVNPPYAYHDIKEDEYALFESDFDVSMVYFYDESISYDTYEALSPIDKEEAMMKYCVTEIGTSDYIDYGDGYSVTDCVMSASHGLSYDNGVINVDTEGGYLDFDISSVSDSEISFFIDGITGTSAYSDMYYQIAVILMNENEVNTADFWVGTVDSYKYYPGKGRLLFNFGYIEDNIDCVRLYFSTPGEYTIDDIKLYSRSQEQLDRTISDFFQHAGRDGIEYRYEGNHIYINSYSEKDKYLYISVPYSTGWSAEIDGEKSEILRANRAFMAVPVKSGTHNIELRYRTPYYSVGVSISCIMIAVFTGISLLGRRFRRKES